jgi:hypothetical protein
MHHRTGCRTSVGIGLFRADCKRHHGNNGMVSRATAYAQRMQMILEMRLHLLGDANALRRTPHRPLQLVSARSCVGPVVDTRVRSTPTIPLHGTASAVVKTHRIAR